MGKECPDFSLASQRGASDIWGRTILCSTKLSHVLSWAVACTVLSCHVCCPELSRILSWAVTCAVLSSTMRCPGLSCILSWAALCTVLSCPMMCPALSCPGTVLGYSLYCLELSCVQSWAVTYPVLSCPLYCSELSCALSWAVLCTIGHWGLSTSAQCPQLLWEMKTPHVARRFLVVVLSPAENPFRHCAVLEGLRKQPPSPPSQQNHPG